MPKFRPLCLPAIATLCLGACSTTSFEVGRNFDADSFSARVVRGTTTREDVRALLGEPASTGVAVETSGQRYDEWTYYYGQGSFSGLSQAKLKTIQVKFDDKGIVQGYDITRPSR